MNDLDLQQRLATPHLDQLGRPDLAAIRRQGTRRRRGRVAAVVAGSALAVAAAAGVGVGLGGVGSDGAGRQTTVYAPPKAPAELSPLARRVLRDVPGAVRVSAGQVVIPGPGTGRQHDEELPAGMLAEPPVPLGAHTYVGVTAYAPTQFPAWLYDEVQRIEQEELGNEKDGYPVGSTEMGILVDSGKAELACLAPRSSSGEQMPGSACHPALVSTVGGSTYLRWGMGSDDFLEPGKEMELFTSMDYTSGSPRTLWIGGLDGTAVDRVALELADGSTVDATVLAGTLVPGDTMFWADVAGELTHVTAYDADGDVVDDHAVTSCNGGVDCEVR
ncbi:hypothetical protein ACT8ZV_08290 [Nocardioides sp. MAHUQ-72]|uniref:hypothetical protein n=1 Tax=unclassified Nocardioides TaxID=2615069 RepID=UPI00361A642B